MSDVKACAEGMERDVWVQYMLRVHYDMLLLMVDEGNPESMSFLNRRIYCIWEELKLIAATDPTFDGQENANSIPSSKSGKKAFSVCFDLSYCSIACRCNVSYCTDDDYHASFGNYFDA